MVRDWEYYKNTGGKFKYIDVYCACKGMCDRNLESYYSSKGYTSGWNDISDLIIPYQFLAFYMGVINRIRDGKDIYTDVAFEKLKDFMIQISQIAMKNQSKFDVDRIKALK